MNQSPKNATTAGLLGIFLGAFGAHSWYLEDKKNGIIHVSLFGGGVLLAIIGAIITSQMSVYDLIMGNFSFGPILSGLGYAVISGDGIWGFIEGIMILSKGDAGLAAKGIPVAAAQQPYAQQPYPNQAQPYPNQAQPYAQPMPQQPVNSAAPVAPQPMNPAQPAPQPMNQAQPEQQPMNGGMNDAA